MAENKDKKVLNVPNIRFPEFKEEWEECRLGEIGEVNMCKRILASQTNTEGGVPFYKIGTIGGLPDAYITKELFESYKEKYNYPYKGEVMITCAGTVGKCIIYDGQDAYFQDSNIVWIKNSSLQIDNAFLYNLLKRVDWRKLNSTTIIRIYNDDLRNLKLCYPKKEEQLKISKFLSLLDERIATQNKIIDKFESLIKGTCNYCINKISRQGAYKKLGEICHITTGKLDANAMVDDGKFPFFTCAANPFNIDKYAFDTEALLISGNGANLGYINYYNGRFNAYQRTYVLDSFIENIQYIKFALKATLPKRIEIEKSTSNTPYIVLSTLSEMKLPIPNKTIQNNVAGLMLSLENKLHFQVRLLEAYNQQKQYLLRQMFI